MEGPDVWAHWGGRKFVITMFGMILLAIGGHHAIVTKQVDAIGAIALGIGGMVAAFNGSNFGATWASSKHGKPTDPSSPAPRPSTAGPFVRARDD
jgi:hypothetical protein